MYKTRIQSIEGKYCTDVKGSRLEIISNVDLFPGASVYTDGRFIYGWHWNSDTKRKPLGANDIFIGLRVAHAHGSYDWPVLAGFTSIIPAYNVKNNMPIQISSFQPFWHGRDTFLYEGNAFKSIRGSWTSPVIYTPGQHENWHSKALYLQENAYETGDWISRYAKKYYSRVWDVNYNYSVIQEQLDDPANYEHYPAYAIAATADKTDIQVHINDTVVSVNPILQEVLNTVKSKVLQKQAMPDSSKPSYPTAQPGPQLTGFALGSVGDLEAGNVYNTENWYHAPTDKDTAQGGCPAYTVDYSSISELASYAFDIDVYFTRHQDYRRIHNLKVIDSAIHFDIYLLAYYVYYPYCKTLSYDSRYSPAMPSTGAYLWCGAGLRYEGIYHVAVESGTASFDCMCERFKTDMLYDYPATEEDGTLVSYAIDYPISKTEKGKYIFRNHKIIRVTDNTEETLDGDYLWCSKIIEYKNLTYAVAAKVLDGDSSYDDKLSHVFVFEGTTLRNDLWMTNYDSGEPDPTFYKETGTLHDLWLAKSYRGLLVLNGELKDVPLYVVDE